MCIITVMLLSQQFPRTVINEFNPSRDFKDILFESFLDSLVRLHQSLFLFAGMSYPTAHTSMTQQTLIEHVQ